MYISLMHVDCAILKPNELGPKQNIRMSIFFLLPMCPSFLSSFVAPVSYHKKVGARCWSHDQRWWQDSFTLRMFHLGQSQIRQDIPGIGIHFRTE